MDAISLLMDRLRALRSELAACKSLRHVLVLGDSLAVGTMPYLDSMLPTDVNLTWDAVDGRKRGGNMIEQAVSIHRQLAPN